MLSNITDTRNHSSIAQKNLRNENLEILANFVYKYFENTLETNMKTKIAHHLEKQSNIKTKTLILIIYFDYL